MGLGSQKDVAVAVAQGSAACPVSVNQLVHSPGPESSSNGIYHGYARIDVTDELRFALTCICALFEQYNLRLLQPQPDADQRVDHR